jgi:hypothetical protein
MATWRPCPCARAPEATQRSFLVKLFFLPWRPAWCALFLLTASWGCTVYDAPVEPAGGMGGGTTASTSAGTTGGAAGTGVGGASVVDASEPKDDRDANARDGAPSESGLRGDDARGSELRDDAPRRFDSGTDATRPAEPDEDAATDASPDAVGECVRESRSAFCLRLGKNCGTVSARDNCGSETSQDCGSCIPLETCGGLGMANICGAPPNIAQNGTVTASNAGIAPEDMTKAFDHDGLTKWFVFANQMPWIAYQFAAGTTHVVTSYGIASANDFAERDPTAWQLQGSNDGTTWTTLDTRTAQTFPNRFQTTIYAIANQTAYQRYRLQITATNGSPDVQLAEILLFGN